MLVIFILLTNAPWSSTAGHSNTLWDIFVRAPRLFKICIVFPSLEHIFRINQIKNSSNMICFQNVVHASLFYL
mgnify:CR=1 FL=1